ncbi:uncharacterized protein DEA37_0003798 [Paragonimus westermani]|uniref:DUF4200 domain-containing protein n=1 Tax=Paragonimus westermani TaxID=34504 RepID=A0A5J4P309_9TREM|nr:uncharacterized protein DEA37_0003798 [Paragonimus westermani]
MRNVLIATKAQLANVSRYRRGGRCDLVQSFYLGNGFTTVDNVLANPFDKVSKLKADLAQLKEFRVKIEHIQQRRQKLEDKECQLKESLIKFERFFKENDDKRLRALKKLSAERGLQRQRQREIEALNACNSKLLQKRNKLDSSVKCLSKYRRFLEEIVKQSDDFNEITEIISRYDALSTNLNDLKERDNAINQISEDMRVNLHKYKEPQTCNVVPWSVELEPPTETEVRNCIAALKRNKAAGPDNLVPALFKEGGEALIKASTYLFQLVWTAETISSKWGHSIIVPIFKKDFT